MCRVINIIDAVQFVLDRDIKMLQSADTTEGDFKDKIELLYRIDDRRDHLVRARMFAFGQVVAR